MRAAILATVTLLCLASAWTDLRSGKIPNLLIATFSTLALLLSFLAGGARGLAGSLSGATVGLTLLLVPFLLHMVGAGDVKLLAAGGAFLGWRLVILSFVAGAFAGGLLATCVIIARSRSLDPLRRRIALLGAGLWREAVPQASRSTSPVRISIPYAVPLSVGLLTISWISLIRGGS